MNELKSLEGILVPASKLDLGSDLQSVSNLQESFNSTKPQFLVSAGLEIFIHLMMLFDSGHNKTIQRLYAFCLNFFLFQIYFLQHDYLLLLKHDIIIFIYHEELHA